jgi:carbon-monoxide dehydrogenase medium subunit
LDRYGSSYTIRDSFIRKEESEVVTFYRRLPRVGYLKPGSLGEALGLLDENRDGRYTVYAGGTDVIPKLKARFIETPEALIDLKAIRELDFISYDEKTGLRIGALATISSVVEADIVKKNYPILYQAAHSIASTHIQNRGTIVGNICNAVPSADSAPALLCLGAKVVCAKRDGERLLQLENFFMGPNKTSLRTDELVTEIRVPPPADGARGAYIKLSPRSRMDLAVVGVAALVRKTNSSFGDARIGLCAVAPIPMRALKAEARLRGETASEKVILAAAKAAADESKPISDHRASAEYRRMMVEVLVARAIRQALSN